LSSLVATYGTNRKWPLIATQMNSSRTGKQCWERYHNHLKPDICKSTWTEEENRAIISYRGSIGKKWSQISKLLPGRSDNDVKNRWNYLVRNNRASASIVESSEEGMKCEVNYCSEARASSLPALTHTHIVTHTHTHSHTHTPNTQSH
jgi:hypothetical protein